MNFRQSIMVAVSSMALAAAATPGAFAQSAPQAEPQADEAVQEVVVTGSRIARRDYVSTSPIVTAERQAIEQSGQVNVEVALQQLPQFTGGRDATIPGLGNGGYATVNLRGLGETRNLVLLDGHRLPIATGTGATDINIVPSSMVGSVEVISGGASAVYGSDAISGVVNFKTRQLNGLELDIQRNQSYRGDAGVWNGSVSAGGRFGADRGRFFVTGSYTDRELVFYKERSFFQRAGGSGSQATGSVQFTGGAPSAAAINTVFGQYGVAAGAVPTTSRFGFNSDGTLYSVTGGLNFKESLVDYGLVGGQIVGFTTRENYLISPQKRYNVFGKVSYEIAPGVEIYAQLLYSDSKVTTAGAWAITAPAQLSLPVTNPFIPADLRTLLASRPAAAVNSPVLLFKGFQEVGRRTYAEHFETYQAVGGIRGKFSDRWDWDLFGSVDKTTQHEQINHVVLQPRVQRLLDAPDGGASICAGGYNPFGLAASAAISQACVNYLTAPTDSVTNIKQALIEGTVKGDLFTLPAGPAKLAVTAGYRQNKYDFRPDILLIPNYDYTGTLFADIANARYANSPAFATNALVPAAGKVSVKEVAGELLVPLLSDAPFAKSANLTLGARYSDYNLAGGAFTYKAEVDWHPVQELLIRGGYEHAIRAPNVAELFSQGGTVVSLGNPPGAGDPCDSRASVRSGPNGAAIQALCLTQFQAAGLSAGQAAALLPGYTYPSAVVGSTITGNKDLQPEAANTFTVGAVYSPKLGIDALRSLRLSVDYYHISISDQISTVSGATALAKCFNLDGSNPSYDPKNSYCSTIVRSPGSAILFNIGAPYLNLGGTKTSGVDFQLDGEIDVTSKVRFGLHSVVSYLLDYSVQALPGSVWQNYRGTVSAAATAIPPLPTWRGLTTATVTIGRVSTSLRWKYVGAMKDVAAVTSPTPPAGVPKYNLFDFFVRVPFGDKYEVRAGVNNLFDKEPYVVGGVASQTNPTMYDVIGRSFYVAAKLRY